MFVKQFQLSRKTEACSKRRAFRIPVQNPDQNHIRKAQVQQKVIGMILFEGTSDDDARAFHKTAFDDIPYSSTFQRLVMEGESWREITRYTSCEKRRGGSDEMLPVGKETVPVSPDLDVEVNPTFVSIRPYAAPKGEPQADKFIEVVKMKCSRPDVSQEAAGDDLELYAMLKYGESLVFPGEDTLVRASFYYLRKANDKGPTASRPNFDLDFFDTVGGRNIVFTEEYYSGDGGVTPADIHAREAIETFVNGIPEEECSKEDCERCELYDACRYEKPPAVIVKTPVIRSIRDVVLTADQERAIEYEKGIVRINAGAGAGKTAVVALRTVVLLTKGVKPWEICLLTFTNAGAEEMRARISLYNEDFGTGEDVGEMTITTFNSFGYEILKAEHKRFGFTAEPKVIDDVERSRIIADLLNENAIKGLDYRNFSSNTKFCKGALSMAKKVFDIVKAGQFGLADAAAVRSRLGSDQRFATGEAVEKLIELYSEYDERLRADNLIEFADQEVMLFELLKEDPYYLEGFGFKHIIVDEFQDSNKGQVELIRKMTQASTFESLMVVGDDMQAIFGFRDTSPEYMVDFEKFIGCAHDDIYLLENHRSTPEIIEFANKIASNNVGRVSKALIATRPSGKPVVVRGFHSDDDERRFVIEGIKDHLDSGMAPEDIAVIASTKYELITMAARLREEGIPSVMLNPELLLENSRVRAAIAAVACLKNGCSDTKDLLSFANARMGGGLLELSKEAIEERMEEAKTLLSSISSIGDPRAKKKAVVEMLESIDPDGDEVYTSFLEAVKVKGNFDKIAEYAHDFGEFGSQAAYRRNHDYPGVVLTTAHSSKGLEWPVVYAMLSKFDSSELNSSSRQAWSLTEEKRRLVFVTATRARDELYVTAKYVAYGKKGNYHYNKFLQEAYIAAYGSGFDIATVEQEKELLKLEAKAKAAEEAAEARKAEAAGEV